MVMPGARVERSRAVYGVDVGATTYVLDPFDQIHELNDSAALIWSHLVHEVSLMALIARVATDVGEASDFIAEDVRGFVDELVSLGLLTVRHNEPAQQ